MAAIRRKLDKSRPYANVYGLLGASFEQDGILFDHLHSEVHENEVKENIPHDSNPKVNDDADIVVPVTEAPADETLAPTAVAKPAVVKNKGGRPRKKQLPVRKPTNKAAEPSEAAKQKALEEVYGKTEA